MRYTTASILALASATVITSHAEARVTRLEVTQTRQVADGATWGDTGAYERLDGVAHFEVDPKDPHNAIITDIALAPVNARGMVEFSSPFYILKPVDLAKGNHKLFYGINNRGGQVELGSRFAPGMTRAVYVDPLTRDSLGDGLLLRMGYTYVDAGWQGDGSADGKTLMGSPGLFPSFPVATSKGKPITGRNRLELQPGQDGYSMPLVPFTFHAWPAASTKSSKASLTVRDRQDAPRRAIPSKNWAFGTCPDGRASLATSATDICLFDGFKAGKIYELSYIARDPRVMGLGYAVTRDMASFLRYETRDDAGNPNPLRAKAGDPAIVRAYAAGASSTGMYSREFLYLGFNADEHDRRVFDGYTINTAGTQRLFANVRFANPHFYASQPQHSDFLSNAQPPFTFGVTTDPVTGITDGILKRPATDPLVMQIDSGPEFWNWKASLNVADGKGNPVSPPPGVRLYFLNGAAHGGNGSGLFTPPFPMPDCQLPMQSTAPSGDATIRALVVAMDEWADKGIAPPPTRYPSLEAGTLVSLEEYQAQFPRIPAVSPPRVHAPLFVYDFGPGFGPKGGVLNGTRPRRGAAYRILQARPDRDGNDTGGVGQMEVRVPLGTNVGWNLRTGSRAPDLCLLAGGYIPFARTKADREAAGDPRLSLEERYGTHAGFVAAVRHGAQELVAARLMLREDLDRYVTKAEASDVLK